MAALFLAAVLLLAFASGCRAQKPAPAGEKLVVAATVFPLYDFARQVGGEHVEVIGLLPPGVEAHHWEPGPQDALNLRRARVFIYNGAGMEPWAEKYAGNLAAGGAVVVEASRGLDLLPVGEGEDGDHAHPGSFDPHAWLDPVLACEMVRRVAEALAAADPERAAAYRQRAADYTAQLEQLDREFRERSRKFARREFVTSHAAFGYLARRYGLRQLSLAGVYAEGEPDPVTFRRLVDFCRREGIKYVFYEPGAGSRMAEALAREVGARTLVLHPLETLTPQEMARGETYLSLMRQNMANLSLALEE